MGVSVCVMRMCIGETCMKWFTERGWVRTNVYDGGWGVVDRVWEVVHTCEQVFKVCGVVTV